MALRKLNKPIAVLLAVVALTWSPLWCCCTFADEATPQPTSCCDETDTQAPASQEDDCQCYFVGTTERANDDAVIALVGDPVVTPPALLPTPMTPVSVHLSRQLRNVDATDYVLLDTLLARSCLLTT